MKVGPAVLQTLATQLVQSGASVTTAVLIARGLGPAGQGRYALFVAAVGLLSTLAAVGQYEGNVLVSAGELSRGRVLLVRSLLQSLAALAILGVTRGLWRKWLGPEMGTTGAALLVVVLGAEVLALLFRGINLGQHHVTAYNAASLTQRLVYLAGVGTLRVFNALTLLTVLVAWLVAVGTSVVLSGSWIWRRSYVSTLSWPTIRAGWASSLLQGSRALLTITLTLLLVRADVYMLGPMLGVRAIGQISVASTLAEYLWYIPSILSSVLFAAVAGNRGPETIAKLCRASRTTVAALVPVALVLLLLGRSLVPAIYGSAYAEAGTLFVLLVPGMCAISLHLVVDSYFAGSGFPPISYIAAGAALLLKVCLNLVAVRWLGIEGAVIVTSIVYVSLLAAKVAAFRRATGARLALLFRPSWNDLRYTARIARSWAQRLGQTSADARA